MSYKTIIRSFPMVGECSYVCQQKHKKRFEAASGEVVETHPKCRLNAWLAMRKHICRALGRDGIKLIS